MFSELMRRCQKCGKSDGLYPVLGKVIKATRGYCQIKKYYHCENCETVERMKNNPGDFIVEHCECSCGHEKSAHSQRIKDIDEHGWKWKTPNKFCEFCECRNLNIVKHRVEHVKI